MRSTLLTLIDDPGCLSIVEKKFHPGRPYSRLVGHFYKVLILSSWLAISFRKVVEGGPVVEEVYPVKGVDPWGC